jgi:hypothetical protein
MRRAPQPPLLLIYYYKLVLEFSFTASPIISFLLLVVFLCSVFIVNEFAFAAFAAAFACFKWHRGVSWRHST